MNEKPVINILTQILKECTSQKKSFRHLEVATKNCVSGIEKNKAGISALCAVNNLEHEKLQQELESQNRRVKELETELKNKNRKWVSRKTFLEKKRNARMELIIKNQKRKIQELKQSIGQKRQRDDNVNENSESKRIKYNEACTESDTSGTEIKGYRLISDFPVNFDCNKMKNTDCTVDLLYKSRRVLLYSVSLDHPSGKKGKLRFVIPMVNQKLIIKNKSTDGICHNIKVQLKNYADSINTYPIKLDRNLWDATGLVGPCFPNLDIRTTSAKNNTTHWFMKHLCPLVQSEFKFKLKLTNYQFESYKPHCQIFKCV